MKPAPFEYRAPRSLEETLAHLAAEGDAAKLLAGGQSLIPVMNFRLAQPAILIDINRVPYLDGVAVDTDNNLRLGALVRHATLERDLTVARHAPLLAAAIPSIAHSQIRNRGTLGG
ncbi:MAG: FAD binding domain-containing protein, partial [Thermoanaerobaculia bacterium]|nr:FAD binding domain-containing protein [Thermoanaerobaculia bacterium]